MEDLVTITVKEYIQLKEDSRKLLALEMCGVDNWVGYDESMKLLDSWEYMED